MNETDALELVQYAMWTVMIASLPAVMTAMVVGTSIALFQALTQIQEITLTFVPKIIAIFLAVALFAPLIAGEVSTLTNVLYKRIETGF